MSQRQSQREESGNNRQQKVSGAVRPELIRPVHPRPRRERGHAASWTPLQRSERSADRLEANEWESNMAYNFVPLEDVCVPPDISIRDAMEVLNSNTHGIVLIVENGRTLEGTVTDGDFRRAFLAGMSLSDTIHEVIEHRDRSAYPRPVTAHVDTPPAELLRLMKRHKIRHIPLVNSEGLLESLADMRGLIDESLPQMRAMIMAGGYGTRLQPLTDDTPKPMLPVGDRPMMEHILQRIKDAGIRDVDVSVHYKPEKITDHFGNGERFGVDIRYISEDSPLGTAGVLSTIEPPNETMLVINGDVLTDVNFRAMQRLHEENAADITVGVRRYSTKVAYGVVEVDGMRVTRLEEKPDINVLINAGIYLLEPGVLAQIPENSTFQMTDLIQRVIDEGGLVCSYPIVEYWLDIGQHDDYQQAQNYGNGKRGV